MVHSIIHELRRAALVALPAGLLCLGACSLDVATPDVVPESATQGPTALPTALAGTVGDFAVAYSGYNNGNNGDGIVLISGLMADEFIATDYFDTHYQIDTRSLNPSNSTNDGVLRNLQRALVSAQNAADAYHAAGQDDVSGRARAYNLVGYAYLLIAENYCSGVPFSSIDAQGHFIFGAPMPTTQMLQIAEAKFDSAAAVAQAAGDDQQFLLAHVGKGRALLFAGQYADAAAAVADVPTSFTFATEQGTASDRTKNGIYTLTYESTRYTVADSEANQGIPFVSANDPRVQTVDLGPSAFDQGTELFAPAAYSSYSAPTVIASGIEARLIEAEAALQAGNYDGPNGTLQILDQLRSAAGMAPLAAAATGDAQVDQLFRERAFWLFGTAHRLADLRRLVRPTAQGGYGRDEAQVFPTGSYFKGGSYGNQVSLLVPQDEGQNPKYTAGACDPTNINLQ